MAHEYASKQPAGFKNHLQNIAIAGGQCGKYIVEHLLANGHHTITALTRANSTNQIPPGVHVKPIDYADPASLVAALKGQDCLIITMAVTAPRDQEAKLVQAAAEAKVPWVLPNEWGSDGADEEVGKATFLGPMRKKVREQIESLGVSSWIGVACMFWYEFSLGGGPYRYGFDFKKREVTFFGDGTTRINTSTWPQTGRSVAKLLALKLLPEDEHDQSPSLAQFKNKFMYVSSFRLSQKEMFESVLRVTGEKASDWKVTHVEVKDRYAEAVKEFQGGNRAAFATALYSRYFFPDAPGDFEARRALDNEKLGLPKEELDEYTKIGVGLAESGYFDGEFGG